MEYGGNNDSLIRSIIKRKFMNALLCFVHKQNERNRYKMKNRKRKLIIIGIIMGVIIFELLWNLF